MEENKTKVSPTESYLLKRVKELEKEKKVLEKHEKIIREELKKKHFMLEDLSKLSKELANFFEIRSDESDKFDFSYFNGSYLHVFNKSGDIDKCDKALIDFLNYVKENL